MVHGISPSLSWRERWELGIETAFVDDVDDAVGFGWLLVGWLIDSRGRKGWGTGGVSTGNQQKNGYGGKEGGLRRKVVTKC